MPNGDLAPEFDGATNIWKWRPARAYQSQLLVYLPSRHGLPRKPCNLDMNKEADMFIGLGKANPLNMNTLGASTRPLTVKSLPDRTEYRAMSSIARETWLRIIFSRSDLDWRMDLRCLDLQHKERIIEISDRLLFDFQERGASRHYFVRPIRYRTNGWTAPLRVGTMNGKSFFRGAIGKVAIYDFELNREQMLNHAQVMFGSSTRGLDEPFRFRSQDR